MKEETGELIIPAVCWSCPVLETNTYGPLAYRCEYKAEGIPCPQGNGHEVDRLKCPRCRAVVTGVDACLCCQDFRLCICHGERLGGPECVL